jgi:hypothetical protein
VMPDFTFTDPGGQKYTITGPNGSTPEQAFAVLQQHLTGAGSRRDASPADWGAVPAEPEGPARWGAIPLEHHEKNAPGMVELGPIANAFPPVANQRTLDGLKEKMATPPPGFVLDQQPAGQSGPNPPPDFVLDKPTKKSNRAYNLDSEKEKSETPGLVSGVVRAIARGAPIVGGTLNKADAATDAALSYALNPLFSEKDQLHGSLAERYHQALDTQNKMDEAFHREHPVLDTAAELGGGVASTGGIAKTAMGACFMAQRRCPPCLRQRGLQCELRRERPMPKPSQGRTRA